MFSPLTPDSSANKFHNSFQGGKGARLQLGEHLESDFDFYNCFTFWELLTWVPPTKTSKAVGCGDLRIRIRGGAVCTILIDLIDRTLLHKQYSINQVIVLMHFFVKWLSSVDLLNCCLLADLVPFGEGVPTQKLLGRDLTCSHGGFPLVIFLCLVVVVVPLLAAAVYLTFHPWDPLQPLLPWYPLLPLPF